MTYCKQIDEKGEVQCLLTYDADFAESANPLEIIITQEEHAALLGKIALDEQDPEGPNDEISAKEALDIILGGAQA